MKRRIFNLAAATSLLLCLACVFLWVGSGFVTYVVADQYGQVNADAGNVKIQWTVPLDISGNDWWGYDAVPRDATPRWVWNWPNCERLIDSSPPTLYVVDLPCWFLTLATAILPALWFRKRRREQHRQRVGLCTKCGFDLRGSQECCPKCDTPVPAPALAPDSAALHRLPWKRRLCARLPLTLLLAFGLLWVVSCLRPTGFVRLTATSTVAVVSENGLLYLTHLTPPPGSLEGEPSEWRIVDHDTNFRSAYEVFLGGEDHSTLPGVWVEKYATVFASSLGSTTPWPYFSVGIAYWIPCLLFGFLSVVGLLRRLRSSRQRHRLMHGFCPTGGYDLRATPERCPEMRHAD